MSKAGNKKREVKEDHALIRNADLQLVIEGLAGLSKTKISMVSAMRVRKIIRAVADHSEDVDELRKSIIERYAKRDAEGKPVEGAEPGSFEIEDTKAAHAELVELYEQETEFPVVKLSWFGANEEELKKRNVEPEFLIKIGDLLSEDVEF